MTDEQTAGLSPALQQYLRGIIRNAGGMEVAVDVDALSKLLTAFEKLDSSARLLKSHRFDCAECGQGIAVDEDGCCRSCGADAQKVTHD